MFKKVLKIITGVITIISAAASIITGIIGKQNMQLSILHQVSFITSIVAIIFAGIFVGLMWDTIKKVIQKVPLFKKKAMAIVGYIVLAVAVCFGGFSLVTSTFSKRQAFPGNGNPPQMSDNKSESNGTSNEQSDKQSPPENGEMPSMDDFKNQTPPDNNFSKDDAPSKDDLENGNENSDQKNPPSAPNGANFGGFRIILSILGTACEITLFAFVTVLINKLVSKKS